MATGKLAVLKFKTATGADEALATLSSLQKQQLIVIEDAAVVSWPEGKKKPKTKQAVNLAAAGALDGAFWGMLFGLLFFVPFLGLAIGALSGALGGSLADFGIDDGFIKSVREQVTPGTSALFVMARDVVMDRVTEAFKDTDIEIIATNLSKEQEDQLKGAFADEA
ncbi:MAG: DUF1269 domain-containing protein [Chloroflexales bacterium]|nr:DUF1269 domain-containing protein [Chloroflexales bacterium]